MERSSPLAAMQPQAHNFNYGHWNFAMGPPTSSSSGSWGFGSGSFDFKDLSMRQGASDYFSFKPKGASPTANLAVDLSRNFHIDQRQVPWEVYSCHIAY